MAFIIVLIDTEISKGYYDLDAGAAVQNIMLTALEEGIGSCWMGAVDRDKVREVLAIPEKYIINTVKKKKSDIIQLAKTRAWRLAAYSTFVV